ncbi:UPF0481 protein [Senna tora]|uniref:UPF0481 protein n=1 Tax=Senna tora TaxID=362788 RepID=A0A834WSB2_9FABA|nr:UPF0481 protein [Senna tora]
MLSQSCCIYKVPHLIRQGNEEAYTPNLVSIGPLHYGNPRLQNMERHKQLLFKQFIDSTETRLEDLIKCVESAVPKVRACYSENIDLSERELVKLILVDATFIIQLFIMWDETDYELFKAGSFFSTPFFRTNIFDDLLLLENQLPFFVLQDLFNRAFPPHVCKDLKLPSFLELTFKSFRFYNMQNVKPNPDTRINHFTDLLRIFYLQKDKSKRSTSTFKYRSNVLSYGASELHEAGVKLKELKGSKCILELKFSGRDLEIPPILVEGRTETLFRNMIALEQFHYPYESYITHYAMLMDCLINTSKDVDVLVHQQIINNMFADSNDVAKIFNGIGNGIVYGNFNSDYHEICTRLNEFFGNPWNNLKATLRNDYCNTPWKTAASIAAIVLLVLTILQTICSVIQLV